MPPRLKPYSNAEDLAKMSLVFQRDYYLMTAKEMQEKWVKDTRRRWVMDETYLSFPAHMQKACNNAFIEHLPLWEYVKHFIYSKKEFDPQKQKMVNIGDFRLYPPLHKDVLCKEIERYVVQGQQEPRSGLAIFITRMGLKTYVGCIGLASWLLTRHRILWGDYTTIRIIHDVEEKAVRRAAILKGFHTRNRRLREMYPEVCLPKTGRWMSDGGWDLPGREKEDDVKEDIDFQIYAQGIRSSMQGAHPMYTILDDLESERHSDSEATVKETKNYFTGAAFSEQIGLSKNILLGTFYNPSSIHAAIAEKSESAKRGEIDPEGTWEVIWLPAILDEGLPTERPLYPLRLDMKTLRQKEKQVESDDGTNLKFRMQMMLDFKASVEVSFSLSRWQEVNLLEPTTEKDLKIEASLSGVPCLVQCDFAGKDATTSGRGDWNAVWVVKYPVLEGQVHRVILDGFMDNTSTIDDGCRKALEMATLYDAWWVVAEESPSHKVVGNALNRISADLGMSYFMGDEIAGRVSGNIIPLVPRNQGKRMGNISAWKMGRMMKFQHAFNSNRVWFNSDLPYDLVEALKAQLGPFPFIKKDDLIDALSMADDERMSSKLPAPRIKATPLRGFGHLKRRTQPSRMTKYTKFAF